MRNRLKVLAGMLLVGGSAAAAAAPPPAFVVCGVCHKTVKGAPASVGPNLHGIGGRKAGSQPGFVYSPAMRKAGFAWNRPRLIAFISKPQAAVPGTRMIYVGQRDPKIAAALADYLLSLK